MDNLNDLRRKLRRRLRGTPADGSRAFLPGDPHGPTQHPQDPGLPAEAGGAAPLPPRNEPGDPSQSFLPERPPESDPPPPDEPAERDSFLPERPLRE